MTFQEEEDETVTFYIEPPSPTHYPPQGPNGGLLRTVMNNFYSSLKKISTHYRTWLFYLWIWRRRCLKFTQFWRLAPPPPPPGPHGGHWYHLNNFEYHIPRDEYCQVWLKSDNAFSRRRSKCKKFTDDAQRTGMDGNSSSWAFGSGELKTIQGKIHQLLIYCCEFTW